MIDLDGVAVKRGDYDVAELEGRASVITGDAVAQYRRLTVPGVPAVAFCVSVAHAQSVAEAFRAAGYRSEAVYGDMDQHDRDRILSGLGTGRQDVVTACDLISEGLDIPEIGAGIMLRPTRSLALAIQQVGRCLRPATGKEAAIILDHAGNCLRHGLPDEPREWSLDGAKRRKRASEDPPCRRCDQCYGVHHPAATCPFCGYVYPPKPRTVKQQAGELTLMERTVRRQQVGRCRTIEELKRVANERGYAAGWVWRMARVKGIRV
jgi:superfamily II DNA or RNA helicase